jgi:hypothetical protein
MVLNKSNIMRDAYATGRRIIASIALMLRTISQKNTLNRLCSQFCALTRGKQNIECASENVKMVIFWRGMIKYFTRASVRQLG